MKKIKLIFTGILAFLIICLESNAASASLSVSSNNVYSGDSFTAYVNMYGAAAWNLHVAASGPVSGCKLDIADATLDALDTNKSFPVTCISTGTGTITITLSGDVTSANDGNAVNVSGTASVNVTNKPAPTPDPTPTPTPEPTPTPSPKPSNPQPTTPTQSKSSDNNIKNIEIKNVKDFTFKSDVTSYNLSVDSKISKLDINITLSDNNSIYDVYGNSDFKYGDNEVIIKVTAEDGSNKEYKIIVNRKEPTCDDGLVLKNITIKDYYLNFYKNNFKYTLKIADENKLDINVETNDNNIYEIIGNENLKNGSVIEIKVKSNDESVSYIINIEKVQKQKQSITLTCVFIAVILVIIGATIFLLVKIIKNKKVIDKQKSNIEFI